MSKSDVEAALEGAEQAVVGAVDSAYRSHSMGRCVTPHSAFLRFPDSRNRIIALPALMEDPQPIAGVKWIASFPDNLSAGLERASAIMALNDPSNGHVTAVLEAASISAARTAASAALAASTLHQGRFDVLAAVGAGRIQSEIVRFIATVRPECREVLVFDTDETRAKRFSGMIAQRFRQLRTRVLSSVRDAFDQSEVISIATSAVTPSLPLDLTISPSTTVLHISLRDFHASKIMDFDNVVDDRDHVLRENTSLHRAVQEGAKDPIRTTIGEVLCGKAAPRRGNGRPVVFSPFGLGFLDLAVARLVLQRGRPDLTTFDFLN
jgi:ornithine cyclodeaminase